MKTYSKRDKQVLLLSVVLLFPAMLIGIPGLLFSVLGFAEPMNSIFGIVESSFWLSWLFHPVTIMGGIATSFLLTAWSVVTLDLSNENSHLLGSITIRKEYKLHLLVLGTAVFFTLLIFAYLLVENLQLFSPA